MLSNTRMPKCLLTCQVDADDYRRDDIARGTPPAFCRSILLKMRAARVYDDDDIDARVSPLSMKKSIASSSRIQLLRRHSHG